MKKLFLILILLNQLTGYSQKTYKIDGFSKKYYAELKIDNPDEIDEVFFHGQIDIYDRKTKKRIIHIESDNLAVEFDEKGNIKTNVMELPYGEQSIIIAEDFNFDGVKDLAVSDGNNSCYGGPSYQIYLSKNSNLIHSPEFTRLAQEYCGMFQVDPDNKTISTMTKDGCCWHEFTEYKIVNDIPQPVLRIVDDHTREPIYTFIETKWDKNRKTVFQKTLLDEENIHPILSFRLKNGKKAILFSTNDTEDEGFLYYALLKKDKSVQALNADESVEFFFPYEYGDKKYDFLFDTTDNTLSFQNKKVKYSVYIKKRGQKITKAGIKVKINDKTYDLKAIPGSIKGDFKDLKNKKFYNVRI